MEPIRTNPLRPLTASVGEATTPSWLLPVREQWRTLGTSIVVLGAGLWLIAFVSTAPAADLIGLLGWFLLLHGLLILLNRLATSPARTRLHQRLRAAAVQHGAGFYGLLALARFAQLESTALATGLVEARRIADTLLDLFREWLIGFSVQSFENLVASLTWPVSLVGRHGWVATIIVAVLAYGMHAAARRVFPEAQVERDAQAA